MEYFIISFHLIHLFVFVVSFVKNKKTILSHFCVNNQFNTIGFLPNLEKDLPLSTRKVPLVLNFFRARSRARRVDPGPGPKFFVLSGPGAKNVAADGL